MSVQEDPVQTKYERITRDLQEIVGEEEIKDLLKTRDLKIYWGTATTGKPHLAYFVPIYKISDFLAVGSHVTILFADIHAYLDNMKTDWELLKHRCAYYELIIKEMLTVIGVPLDKLRFIRGSDFELSEKYTLDVYRISALVTTEHTTKAGAEVVRQVRTPLMSSLLYPILQALDEQYLDVDVQFGGVDQRKIFMFARESLPKIGYKKRSHLMNPLVPGLGKSGKMSSSEASSKIDFEDSNEVIEKKIMSAFSEDGVTANNGLLGILKFIIFRELEKHGSKFVVKRSAEFGGDVQYSTYKEVEEAFANKSLASADLKKAIIPELLKFVVPLRDKINQNIELYKKAYPDENIQVHQTATAATIGLLDIRVCRVISTEIQRGVPVLKADTGRKDLLQLCCTLDKTLIEEIKDKLVIVIMNSDPDVSVKGIKTQGILLVSQSKDKKQFGLIHPPEGVPIGEQIQFGDVLLQPEENIIKKRFSRIIGTMETDEEGHITCKGNQFFTSKGPCTTSIKGGLVTSPGCV